MRASLQVILEEGRTILKKAGVNESELNAWYLFSSAFQIDKAHYLLSRQQWLSKEQELQNYPRFMELIKRRAMRIPLQYVLGMQEFMGLDFKVNEHVLIPRQDTETLVELVLKEQFSPQSSVLDMCTGSGCIAVSLAKLGGYQNVTGGDISEEALEVAKHNAKLNQCSAIEFVKTDMFSNIKATYDIIVSNPPYIPSKVIEGLEPEVRNYEPILALDGMEDGLKFYRILSKESYKYLNPKGSIYFEIGHDQGGMVSNLLDAQGYLQIKVINDAAGRNRVVKATLPN